MLGNSTTDLASKLTWAVDGVKYYPEEFPKMQERGAVAYFLAGVPIRKYAITLESNSIQSIHIVTTYLSSTEDMKAISQNLPNWTVPTQFVQLVQYVLLNHK